MRQLLSDVAVVELSTDPAGSYCGKVFADLGADVVKVEAPAGDPAARAPRAVRAPQHEQARRRVARRRRPDARSSWSSSASADVVVESQGVGDLAGLRPLARRRCARSSRRWSSRPSAASAPPARTPTTVVRPGGADRGVDDLPPGSIARGAGARPRVSSPSARSATPPRSARWPASCARVRSGAGAHVDCRGVRGARCHPRARVPVPRLGVRRARAAAASPPTPPTPCSPPASSRAPTATCR